ncbi:MAG: hypothetical protein EPN82_05915 [Bacteroidetes bacterium]|nr:MAG: hypothetical protein EPN82_05915 [Bacteroidota bacterium]
MINKNLTSIIDDIIKGNLGLFFGAGVSINSGIPTTNIILKKILSALNMSIYSKQLIALNYPFESFMEELSLHLDIDNFLNIFLEGQPNHFNFLVKKLIDKGIVKNLMTTNFDLLIEKTPDLNLNNILVDEKSFRNIDDNTINYIKIHGCASKKNTIRTTMSQIFKKQLREGRSNAINYFFKESNIKNILVLGYSCSDNIDITPIIKNISGSKSQIIFIEHSDKNILKVFNINKHILFNNFQGKWIKCNTDTFLEECYDKIFGVSIPYKISKFDIDKYFDFKNIKVGIPELILGNIFFKNSKFDISKVIYEKALLSNKLEKKEKADIYTQLTEVYYNIYLNDDLKKVPDYIYNLAIDLYEELKDNYGLGQIFNHIGHIKSGLKLYDEAEKTYNLAESYFKKVNNKYRIAQILINKGHVYLTKYENTKNQVDFEKSKDFFYKSDKYFRNSGYIFEFAILLYNRGCLWAVKPKSKRLALKYLEESKRYSFIIGDQEGVKLCKEKIKELNSTK